MNKTSEKGVKENLNPQQQRNVEKVALPKNGVSLLISAINPQVRIIKSVGCMNSRITKQIKPFNREDNRFTAITSNMIMNLLKLKELVQ